MLYNSYAFLLVFLPATLLGYYAAFGRLGVRPALAWLGLASLAFYAWWRPIYVGLIVASMLANLWVGTRLGHTFGSGEPLRRRRFATLAVAGNLALLGYFKYVHFLSEVAAQVLPIHHTIAQVVLPLGISFFTFEQVGYVVDAYRGKARDYSFVEYVFFVTFFPHLIAGPIIVHSDLLGQVGDPKVARFDADRMACGVSLFTIGLVKKVLIADSVATFAQLPFGLAAGGQVPAAPVAWLGLVSYAMQLYFDFSGYSDMGLGLARMLGFKLPLNFDSPYKAHSIIDFWRRWHMTLSRFLREMIYIPLGGNRKGEWAKHRNLFATMLLGGLWHGAGWNFIIWGALHGGMLVANHMWVDLRSRHLPWLAGAGVAARAWRQLAVVGTFLLVLVGWVFFRSQDLPAAVNMLAGLAGGAGAGGAPWALGQLARPAALCLGAYALARLAPNSQQLLAAWQPALTEVRPAGRLGISWQPGWAVAAGLLLGLSVLGFTQVSEFLYFQF